MIARATFTEAYPPPETVDDSWYVWARDRTFTPGKKSLAPFVHTNQPTLLFRDRTLDDYREIFLLGAGMLLGIAGALILRLGKVCVESIAGRVAQRNLPD